VARGGGGVRRVSGQRHIYTGCYYRWTHETHETYYIFIWKYKTLSIVTRYPVLHSTNLVDYWYFTFESVYIFHITFSINGDQFDILCKTSFPGCVNFYLENICTFAYREIIQENLEFIFYKDSETFFTTVFKDDSNKLIGSINSVRIYFGKCFSLNLSNFFFTKCFIKTPI